MSYPHAFIKLTDEERKIVGRELNRFALKGEYKKRKRLQVIYLSDQRHTFDRISQQTGYSYQRVRELIYLYRKEGLKPFIEQMRKTTP